MPMILLRVACDLAVLTNASCHTMSAVQTDQRKSLGRKKVEQCPACAPLGA